MMRLYYCFAFRPTPDLPKRMKPMLLKYPQEGKYESKVNMTTGKDLAEIRANMHKAVDECMDTIGKEVDDLNQKSTFFKKSDLEKINENEVMVLDPEGGEPVAIPNPNRKELQ